VVYQYRSQNDYRLGNFRNIFIKIFIESEDYVSLSDKLYHFKRRPNESIKEFNERFNKLVRSFPLEFKPPKYTIYHFYMLTMNNPYGFLLG